MCKVTISGRIPFVCVDPINDASQKLVAVREQALIAEHFGQQLRVESSLLMIGFAAQEAYRRLMEEKQKL